jgi:hypothetical protein
MSKQKVKSEYKFKDGTIVRVGDMVRYLWSQDDNGAYPIGFVERIEKDYSRWYAKVHLLNGPNGHHTLNTRLCEFHRSFDLTNQ